MPTEPAALAWAARACGSAVVAAEPLHGGVTSAVALLSLADGRSVVLRDNAAEPHLVPREAAVLDLLAGARVPAPRLVAYEGTWLLMTYVPGSPDLRDPRIASTRAVADRVHEIVVPQGFPAFERYYGSAPPPWAGDLAVWRDAAAVADGPAPAFDPVLIHRDLQPLNVLWSGERCTGVVDWPSACVGPAAFDAAHAKANLAMLYGAEMAAAWPNDAYWDVVGVTDLAPDLADVRPWHAHGRTDLTLAVVRSRLEEYLASLLRG